MIHTIRFIRNTVKHCIGLSSKKFALLCYGLETKSKKTIRPFWLSLIKVSHIKQIVYKIFEREHRLATLVVITL